MSVSQNPPQNPPPSPETTPTQSTGSEQAHDNVRGNGWQPDIDALTSRIDGIESSFTAYRTQTDETLGTIGGQVKDGFDWLRSQLTTTPPESGEEPASPSAPQTLPEAVTVQDRPTPQRRGPQRARINLAGLFSSRQ